MPSIIIKDHMILFDDEDSALVYGNKWHIHLGWGETPYARNKTGRMHRIIMQCPKNMMVDHVNHNTLDNRRKNLRLCTRSQNMWNRKRTCGTSRYKGVCWVTSNKRWRVQIGLNGKQAYLGEYMDERTAAKVYNEAAIRLFGEFAYLNKIGDEDDE